MTARTGKRATKGLRPTGADAFVITSSGSVMVNTRLLMQAERPRRVAALVRELRRRGQSLSFEGPDVAKVNC
ncbi:MAG: hypothetical protein IPJ17_08685 [Holophagales bacterium]|nr:MAG: hypothetical protein IPJ17_08685 [Holophagales bacterium]